MFLFPNSSFKTNKILSQNWPYAFTLVTKRMDTFSYFIFTQICCNELHWTIKRVHKLYAHLMRFWIFCCLDKLQQGSYWYNHWLVKAKGLKNDWFRREKFFENFFMVWRTHFTVFVLTKNAVSKILFLPSVIHWELNFDFVVKDSLTGCFFRSTLYIRDLTQMNQNCFLTRDSYTYITKY